MQGESDEHANIEKKLEVRQSGDERTSIFDVLPLVAVPSSDEDEGCEAMMQEKTLVSVVMQLFDLLYDENINDDTFEVDHETFRRFHLELRGTIHSHNSVLFSKCCFIAPPFLPASITRSWFARLFHHRIRSKRRWKSGPSREVVRKFCFPHDGMIASVCVGKCPVRGKRWCGQLFWFAVLYSS